MNKNSIYAERRLAFLKAKEELKEWDGQIGLIHRGEMAISDVDPVMVVKMVNFVTAWHKMTEIWFPEEKIG